MRLLIDIGNTSAKIAVADANNIIYHSRRVASWHDTLQSLYQQYSPTDCVISTVATIDHELKTALNVLPIPVLWFDNTVPCHSKQITNIPKGLGADRWAADLGALAVDSTHPLLIVDAGTCVTYDVINANGNYCGGNITPGIALRLKAMHQHTALLPKLEAPMQPNTVDYLWGKDTETAMLGGVVNGLNFEVEGFIRRLAEQHPDLHVFLTGGTPITLPNDLNVNITHEPLLVLKGLAHVFF
ncbi:MAG: type III pantothenate kinase [Bacteroidales bacterium]|nr:type III pantothenate kinase [Bacteroidales bacterium]